MSARADNHRGGLIDLIVSTLHLVKSEEDLGAIWFVVRRIWENEAGK